MRTKPVTSMARTALLLLGLATLAVRCREGPDAGADRSGAQESRTEDHSNSGGSQQDEDAPRAPCSYPRTARGTTPAEAEEVPREDRTKMTSDEVRAVSDRFKSKSAADNRVDEGRLLYEFVQIDMTSHDLVDLLGEPSDKKNEGGTWYYNLWYSCYIRLRIRDGKVVERELKY